jgi:hypothetical protein
MTTIKGTERNSDFDALNTRQGTGVVYLRYYPTDASKSREIPSGNFLRYLNKSQTLCSLDYFINLCIKN